MLECHQRAQRTIPLYTKRWNDFDQRSNLRQFIYPPRAQQRHTAMIIILNVLCLVWI